jgi:hypothetical protein
MFLIQLFKKLFQWLRSAFFKEKKIESYVINSIAPQNQVSKILLSTESKENVIELIKINKEDKFNNLVKINDKEIENLSSSLVSNAAQQGIIINSLNGLYQASIDPVNLLKYSNESISSIVVNTNGSIVSHSGFFSPDKLNLLSPLITYQLLSFVTGQYYLNNIMTQINNIRNDINVLIKIHHNEKLAKILNYINVIYSLNEKSAIFSEDLNEIRNILLDVGNIISEYELLLNQINEQRIVNDKRFNTRIMKKALEPLVEVLQEDKAFLYYNIIIYSSQLKYFAKVTEFKINTNLSKENPQRLVNASRDFSELISIKNEFNASLAYDKKIESFYDFYIPAIKNIKDMCIFDSVKGKYNDILIALVNEKKEIEQRRSGVTENVNRIHTETFEEKKQEVFIDIDEGKINLYKERSFT